jgi:signal recognition particle receptor subunit beta
LAILHQQDRAIILRIVYDGPPEAGKTTSVKALAQSFGRDVYTPEEQQGRTVYFDWLEHTGGRFDGAPIRCQIVSVPGQDCWRARRLHLLERADVVVFVGDTSVAAWPATLERLQGLRGELDRREGPPVGLVLQANHRDAPNAVPLAAIRREVDSTRIAVIESTAIDGTGVREAFVFAVRLALDRVREEQRTGPLGQTAVDLGGEGLLCELLEREAGTKPAPSEPLGGTRLDDAAPIVQGPPCVRAQKANLPQRLPSHDVPSGLVWPPVEGRIFLREVTKTPVLSKLTRTGDHHGTFGTGHRAHSGVDAVFDEIEEGRAMLVAWARAHVSAQALLSRGRCIVLAATGDGRFRLWQIVREEPSIRQLFIGDGENLVPRLAARQLATASRLLSDAQAACARHSIALPCTLDTIGVSESGKAIYVGDVAFTAASSDAPSGIQIVMRELAALAERRTASERAELCREFLQLQRRELSFAQAAQIEALVTHTLLT